MCVCGCIESPSDFQFPGPNSSTYLLTLNAPCPECITPVGIVIEHFSPKVRKSTCIDLKLIPNLDFIRTSYGSYERAIPLITPQSFINSSTAEPLDPNDLDEVDASKHLSKMMSETIQDWKETLGPGKIISDGYENESKENKLQDALRNVVLLLKKNIRPERFGYCSKSEMENAIISAAILLDDQDLESEL